MFIKGSNPPPLAVVSERARTAFIHLIQRRYMDGDGPESMAPDGWYEFMKAMSKEED